MLTIFNTIKTRRYCTHTWHFFEIHSFCQKIIPVYALTLDVTIRGHFGDFFMTFFAPDGQSLKRYFTTFLRRKSPMFLSVKYNLSGHVSIDMEDSEVV